MRCLVTGGAGFIGSNLASALVARGHQVRILDNFSTGLRENLEELRGRVEVVEGDLRDGEAVARACDGMEVVFHQGAMPSVPRSVEDPSTSFAVNAGGTLNVLLGARRQGVRRVVYAASSSAYGDTPTLPKHERMPAAPRSPYAADKLHGENLMMAFHASYGLETVALRYFNVFGPRQRPDSAYAAVIPRFIGAFLEGRLPLIYGDGRQSRDFTFVQNVVGANLLAAEAEGAAGRVINIGNGSRTTLLELLAEIARILGVPPRAEHAPPRAGDVRDSQADVTAAQEILGYRPSVDLRAGLEATVDWFRKAGPRPGAPAEAGGDHR
jgi:UDP-glucose 4-epimerase